MTFIFSCLFISLMIYMFLRGFIFSIGILVFLMKVIGFGCFGYALYLLVKNYLR